MSTILGRVRVTGSTRLDDDTQSVSAVVIEAQEGNAEDGEAVSGSVSLTVKGGDPIEVDGELHVTLSAVETTGDADSGDVDAPDAEGLPTEEASESPVDPADTE